MQFCNEENIQQYNIVALLLDADGINYATDVEVVQVTADACVTAMENGEIAAALLSDTFAYSMVKEGKLKCIRSQLDSDFADRTCCVMAMNGTFGQGESHDCQEGGSGRAEGTQLDAWQLRGSYSGPDGHGLERRQL